MKPPAPTELLALAREDLAVYGTAMWRGYQLPPHLAALVTKLEAIERGDLKRLLVAMPPRHGKSLTTSVLFPSWLLGRGPEKHFIFCSYGQELSDSFGRQVRGLLQDPRHRAIFPACKLSDDSTAAYRFETTKKGFYFSVGRLGGVTGRGCDVLLVDDPLKDSAEASSETVRAAMREWFNQSLFTRLSPGAAAIVISTRWHEDDLVGWLLNEHGKEGWETLFFPAIAETTEITETNPNTPTEKMRKIGDPLWPERFPLAVLSSIREQLGSRAFASLYQQRPSPAGGGTFKESWLGVYQEVPKLQRVVQAWDAAFKAGVGHDFSACVTVGQDSRSYYVLHAWHGRAEFPELKKKMVELAAEWNPEKVIIEDTAAGISALQELKRETRLPLVPQKATASKVARAESVAGLVEAGKLLLPAAAGWKTELVDELLAFPSGRHDDLVDALVHALTHMRGTETGPFMFRGAGGTIGTSADEWRFY